MISLRVKAMRRVAIAACLVATVALGACDWRGPDPTEAALMASSGPFTVGTINVPSAAGFGGGTIYYPSNNAGPFAEISISPGFIENQTAIAEWGPRLASNGFVVITINTSNGGINPSQRSTEQRQALDYVASQGNNSSSPIFGKVDSNRRGVAGHSMGGGASLISIQSDPNVDAAMPLAPWNSSTNFSGITRPVLILACQNDGVAPVNSHASPFYNSIPATTKKMYLLVTGGDHFCVNSPTGASGTAGKWGVAFFKKFLDTDTRYDPWMCGASKPVAGSGGLSEVRSTCPF